MPERNAEAIADFKKQFDEVHTNWQDFYKYRRFWSMLIDRRLPSEFEPTFRKYADGIDIESPFLAKDRGVHIQILNLDPPRFDCVALESSDDAKKDVEKNRIWHASSAMKQNKGQWLSKSIAQGVVQYGIAWVRKDWHMPLEPDEEYYKGKLGDDYEEDTKDEGRLKKRESARDDYYKEQDDHCFSMVDVSPMEMCCTGLDNPTLVFQRSVIPYSEAKTRLKSLDGKRVRLDQLGNLLILGDSEPDPEDSVYGTTGDQKKIELIIRDMKDPETGEWSCAEYICVEGQDWNEHAEKLNEYVNPLGMSRYFLIPSGDEVPLETDPHLRFVPMLYSELVLVADKNYYTNLLAGLSRMQITDAMFYVPATAIQPEVASALESLGFVNEGAGASPGFTMKRPEVPEGEIGMMPAKVEAWPFPTLDHLRFLIERNDAELAAERPNRFLTAKFGDAKEPNTATQHLDERQAAALPYSSYLIPITSFWEQQAYAERNACLYWDRTAEKGTQKPYPVVTTGDEPLLREPADPATEVVVTAETFKRRYNIVARINNTTQAEKMQNDLAADDEYLVKNASTQEQWLKKRGYEDPKRQMKELERDEWRKVMKARMQPVRMQMSETYFSALLGTNLSAVLPPPEPVSGQQQPQQSSMVQAGPAITPAPVEQPNATSSPAGVM